MNFTDFEFNGQRLSDYGFMVVSYEKTSGIETVDSGSQITYNLVKTPLSNRYKLYSTSYDTCYTFVISIAHMSCENPDLDSISPLEFSHLNRWLNTRQMYKFKPIQSDMASLYCNASCNLKAVLSAGLIIGAEITVQTDSPFLFEEDNDAILYLDSSTTQSIYNMSDDFTCLPIDMYITVKQSGNLEITNLLSGDTCKINNCVAGEKIHIDKNLLISTDNESHAETLASDFNYVFLDLQCTEYEQENEFKANLECVLDITYNPVRKVGVV